MFIFLLPVVLIACGEKKTDMLELEPELTAEIPVVEDWSDASIPVYSFDELQPLLEKNDGTTYVVNFWATWCKPCIKEMPYFEELALNYSKDKVKVVFVSLDFPEKIESQIVPFIEKNKIESEVVLLNDPDANGWIPKVSKEWSGAIPATVVHNGDKRSFHEGSLNYEELENLVQTIL